MRDETLLGYALLCWLMAGLCLGTTAWILLLIAAGVTSLIWVALRTPSFLGLSGLLCVGAHAAWVNEGQKQRVIPFGEVRAEVTVQSGSEKIEPDSPWMQARPEAPRYRVRARVEQIDEQQVEPFGIWLSLPGPVLPGDRFEVAGELRALPSAQWRDDSDPRTLARRRGIEATLSVSNAALLTPLGHTPMLARQQAALSDTLITAGGGAVAAAMVLGDRRFLTRDDEEAMARAGFVHVISVSGLHLSALGAALFWLLRRLTHSRYLAAAAALASVWGYAVFSGAEAPALRSAIMQSFTLMALLSYRFLSPKRALAASLIVLVALFPETSREPSFALSFVTMLALIVVVPRVRVARWLTLPLSSLVASVAAWPLCAMWFGNISLAGVVTNLIAVPLSTFVMLPLGALWLACGAGATWLGVCGDLLTWLAHSVPEALVWDVALRDYEVALAYVALGLGCARGLRRLALVATCGFLFAFALPWLNRLSTDALELHTLPIGQGDGHVVFLPHGQVVVIDGGGTVDGRIDPGRRVLRPFLLTHRVRHIDAVVLTHAHPDHLQGLDDVLRHFSVERFVWNGQGASSHAMQHLLKTVRQNRVQEVLAAEARLANMQVLHPLSAESIFYGELGLNDNSIVLRIAHHGRSILMTGDIEATGEYLLQTPRCDVLKLPHHGSHTSTTPELLAAVQPSIAVVTAGANNQFGHPHAEVLARLEGVSVLRTDEQGHLTVRLSEGRIETEVFRSSAEP
jgi:competence protein ComEC